MQLCAVKIIIFSARAFVCQSFFSENKASCAGCLSSGVPPVRWKPRRHGGHSFKVEVCERPCTFIKAMKTMKSLLIFNAWIFFFFLLGFSVFFLKSSSDSSDWEDAPLLSPREVAMFSAQSSRNRQIVTVRGKCFEPPLNQVSVLCFSLLICHVQFTTMMLYKGLDSAFATKTWISVRFRGPTHYCISKRHVSVFFTNQCVWKKITSARDAIFHCLFRNKLDQAIHLFVL